MEFCNLLGIEKEKFIEKLKKSRIYSPRLPSVLVPQLSKEDYAMLQEKMRKYEAFIFKKDPCGIMNPKWGQCLGYISEVNETDLAKNPYYAQGELTGRTGLKSNMRKS